ncbi:hypothetical protein [Leptospira sp. mild_001]|uniref:hypothetical protein n=1 Tax=Leptospira sp. mild_001 TaxID=2838238 RepID=UPI001E3BF8F2|nr:hypothetical protein [Leptospira sp. mild_001]
MSFRFSSTKSKTFNILSASFWYRLGSKATEISRKIRILKIGRTRISFCFRSVLEIFCMLSKKVCFRKYST